MCAAVFISVSRVSVCVSLQLQAPQRSIFSVYKKEKVLVFGDQDVTHIKTAFAENLRQYWPLCPYLGRKEHVWNSW